MFIPITTRRRESTFMHSTFQDMLRECSYVSRYCVSQNGKAVLDVGPVMFFN